MINWRRLGHEDAESESSEEPKFDHPEREGADALKEAGYVEQPEFEKPLVALLKDGKTPGGYFCATCFPGWTYVFTNLGRKRIDKVEAGDEVFGYDGIHISPTKVQAVGTRVVEWPELVRIRCGKGPKDCYVATREHPFFIIGKGYVPAQDIVPGDEIFFIPKNQAHSILRTYHNPMHDPEIVNKNIMTHKVRYASGELIHRVLPLEERQRISLRMQSNNPMYDSKVVQKSIANHDYSAMGMTSWTKRKDKLPSGIEHHTMEVIASLGLPIRYTGNGSFWRGKKNPDFKVNGQNKVIETWYPKSFGRDLGWAEDRRQAWEDEGFECLMLALTNKTESEVIAKSLQNFVSNGVLVTAVEPYRNWSNRKRISVYNIQTETSNYFVKGTPFTRYVLVHNCEYYVHDESKLKGGWCEKLKAEDSPWGCCNIWSFNESGQVKEKKE
jgi:hypothetical protein